MRKGADGGEKTVVDSRDVAGIDLLPPVTQSSADSWYAIVAIADNLSNGGRGPAEGRDVLVEFTGGHCDPNVYQHNRRR